MYRQPYVTILLHSSWQEPLTLRTLFPTHQPSSLPVFPPYTAESCAYKCKNLLFVHYSLLIHMIDYCLFSIPYNNRFRTEKTCWIHLKILLITVWFSKYFLMLLLKKLYLQIQDHTWRCAKLLWNIHSLCSWDS